VIFAINTGRFPQSANRLVPVGTDCVPSAIETEFICVILKKFSPERVVRLICLWNFYTFIRKAVGCMAKKCCG
jgi:hypothetical protein